MTENSDSKPNEEVSSEKSTPKQPQCSSDVSPRDNVATQPVIPTPTTFNWDEFSKKASSAQSLCVIAATMLGGLWAFNTYFAEGKNIHGCNITISARQIRFGEPEHHFLNVNVDVQGSDRRGYKYDFRKSYLSVALVSFGKDGSPEFKPIARTPPTEIHIEENDNVGFSVNQEGHVSSYRVSNHTFLVPLPKTGIYFVSFSMPSSGDLTSRTKPPPDYDKSDPAILGAFSGEMKAIYVTVHEDPKAAESELPNKAVNPSGGSGGL